MRKEQNHFKQEVKALKMENTKLKKYDEETMKENNEIKQELSTLTNKMERIEKLKREKIPDNATLRETANKFIKNQREMKIKVKKASKIRKDMCLIQVENSEDKQKIMENKAKLKLDDRVYINNDLTKKEPEIQTDKIASEERKGTRKVVKIRFNKLTVDEKTWKWDKTQSRL